MTRKLIKPQTLKGFRDYLPEAMLARERLIETARRVYRSYGYGPAGALGCRSVVAVSRGAFDAKTQRSAKRYSVRASAVS